MSYNPTPYQQRLIRWALATVLVFALAFVGIKYPEPGDIPDFPMPDDIVALGTTNFDTVAASDDVTVGDDLTVTDAATVSGAAALNGGITADTSAFSVADTSGNTVIAGSLAANGGITADSTAFTVADTSGNVATAGTLDVTGAATFANDLTIDDTLNIDDTSYALTGAQTLTPTASYYAINSSAAVTITLIDGSNGDFLTLVNLSANNAIIADTNIRTSTGSAITLGQYDVLLLLFTGTEWYQIALAADS